MFTCGTILQSRPIDARHELPHERARRETDDLGVPSQMEGRQAAPGPIEPGGA